MKRPIQNIFLLSASTIFCIIFAETSLRLFYPQEDYLEFLIKDPVFRMANATNFEGKYRFGHFRTPVNVRLNSQGMRGDQFDPADTSGLRILLIGDSFTFGWGLEDSQTFAHFLQLNLDRLSEYRVKVLNGGVVGWGSTQEIMYLERNYEALQPDIVIATFVSNDIADDNDFFAWQKTGKGELIDFPGKRLLVQSHLVQFLRVLRLKLRNKLSGEDLNSKWENTVKNNPGIDKERFSLVNLYGEQEWCQLQDTYGRLADFCREKSIILIIQSADDDSKCADSFFTKFVTDKPSVRYNLLSPVFNDDSIRKPYFFKNDGHWAPFANASVAHKLFEIISTNKFLKLASTHRRSS